MTIFNIILLIFLIALILFYLYQIGRFISKKENRNLLDIYIQSKLKDSEFVGGDVKGNLGIKNLNKSIMILIGLIIVLHIATIQ